MILTSWPSRENSLKLIELSCINIVCLVLVYVSSCSNTGSIRNNPYWTSIGRTQFKTDRAIQYINIVSLVLV